MCYQCGLVACTAVMVASNLPVKVASCDKALRLQIEHDVYMGRFECLPNIKKMVHIPWSHGESSCKHEQEHGHNCFQSALCSASRFIPSMFGNL